METSLDHPFHLTPTRLQSLISILLPHLPPSSQSPPADPLTILSQFTSLPQSVQSQLSDSLLLIFPNSFPLNLILQQQPFIESALSWTPISFSDDYRADASHKSGGLSLLDPEIVSKIRSVGTEILKQLGKKLLSGNFNLTQLSSPIRCMQASTVLHNTLNTFQLVPLYITRAVASKNALERFKLVLTSTISSFIHTSTFEKPLNPILGETQHAVLEDGTQMYAEQTSHHPPVSHFYVQGSGFKIHGYFNYTAKAGLNSVTVTNVGKRIFEFADGYQISVTCPEEVFSGTFFGTMRHESLGVMKANDNQGYSCSVTIGKIRGKPSDYLTGNVLNSDGDVVSVLNGTYLGFLQFDDVRYWDVRSVRPFRIQYTKVLMSDSETRKDILVLRDGDVGEAQRAKEELENLQRADRKVRGKKL